MYLYGFVEAEQRKNAVGLIDATKLRRTLTVSVHDAILAMALCHNVSPVRVLSTKKEKLSIIFFFAK